MTAPDSISREALAEWTPDRQREAWHGKAKKRTDLLTTVRNLLTT